MGGPRSDSKSRLALALALPSGGKAKGSTRHDKIGRLMVQTGQALPGPPCSLQGGDRRGCCRQVDPPTVQVPACRGKEGQALHRLPGQQGS